MLVSGMIGLTKTMKNVIKMIKFQPETMMMELLWVETASMINNFPNYQ